MLPTGDTAADLPTKAPRAQVSARAHLAVALEADRPLSGGMRIDLEGIDEVLVGRGPERRSETREDAGLRTLILSIPSAAMSANHARITRQTSGERAEWVARDLRSTNGMFVNGRPVAAHRLTAGDVLEMGHTFFLLMGDVASPDGTKPIADLSSATTTPRGVATLMPGFGRDLRALENLATARLPVLVLGETGTGKELLARSIHTLSARTGSLVPVNCAAIPATLVESQLFGHCRGAFSGAVRDEPGLVRSADRGTLFLDEIGDLPLAAQGALLRVLQEGEVLPVGATRPVRVDVRVVAATHRDLASMARAGSFRADLLARLDGASVHIPPLRERRADLGALVATLLPRVAGTRADKLTLHPQAALALLLHAWPTNVRGLEQCLARAAAVAREVIGLEHLPEAVSAALERSATVPGERRDRTRPSANLRDVVIAQLRTQRGNVAAVARALGKAPAQIHRWMRRFGIDPNEYRDSFDVPEA